MNTAVSAEPRVSLRTDRSGSPFRRVLIANRGEIAVRIIRACRDLGVETVAVYSDADASALHVRMADSAIRLGAAPAAESYLRGDLVVAAAIDTNSDAIHPGYGFLSERASFARDVIGAGIAFIGPDPAAIEALGDKVAARRSAHLADVPVVPGTFEPVAIDGDLEQTLDDARRIGFPLLVKAAAGEAVGGCGESPLNRNCERRSSAAPGRPSRASAMARSISSARSNRLDMSRSSSSATSTAAWWHLASVTVPSNDAIRS